MRKTVFRWELISLFAAGVLGCAGAQSKNSWEEKLQGAAPIIWQTFASKQIRPGDDWKVYLIAQDPDGNMKNIVAVIDEPGVGTYPVSITKIQEENRKELSGYVFLNTNSPKDLNFVDLTLTIQIQDQAGNTSRAIVFPLSINNQYRQDPPPPEVFQERNLGPILINLRSLRDAKGTGGILRGGPPFRPR